MAETDLAFAGLARQAEAVRASEVSPRELVGLYLERIGRLNPQLNAYRVVRAEPALAAAMEAEKRRHWLVRRRSRRKCCGLVRRRSRRKR